MVAVFINLIAVDLYTPLSHGHATRIIPEFWHSHGHVNPGSRPCLRAGFRPGFATRLRHNRIVSVKKWRKTDERGLSARRGCFCRSGARIGSSVSCRGSKEQCSISDDCRRAGKALWNARVDSLDIHLGIGKLISQSVNLSRSRSRNR